MELENLHTEYKDNGINKQILPDDPLDTFKEWISAALSYNVPEPNAMTLTTVSNQCISSARIVLLKNFDRKGLVFYSNYNSRKAKDIEINPQVSVLFYWPTLERQIRIGGKVVKTSAKESNEYFSGRPRQSQLAAWASPQSEFIPSREYLLKKLNEMELKFKGKKIPRPSYWGGYRVLPDYYEFWQGRPGRLNDRILYVIEKEKWQKLRLAP